MHRRLIPLVAAVLALVLAPAAATVTESQPDRRTLERYATDTWRSFVQMTNPTTGLSADNVTAEGVRAKYTSPTNIAAYIWSTLAARDLGIVKPSEARKRIEATLTTLAGMERHERSGQYFNWYDPDTGEKLTVWPVDRSRVYLFLSSVDNGWLAAALMMVGNSIPQLRREADAILEPMDFGFYYDPNVGQLRGGAWTEPPPGCSVPSGDVYYTCHHYGSLNTEPRIASYIGIARGQIPATHYFKLFRTFPETCDWSWQEQKPAGVTRTYLGVDVYEGHYNYRGMKIVPSWGGSMFEALMVPLLVPEEEWAPHSWGVNHPLYVRAQIEHGLEEAKYGYWGFSPSNDPDGGYREYGVDPIGLNPDGYASDQERTLVDYGFGECRAAQPAPGSYGRGTVTPHASFLALDYEPEAALANLAKLRRNFDAYGSGGFYDAIEVKTGKVARFYLALDQGMIMVALANELRNDRLQAYFTRGEIARVIRPLIAQERFTAGTG
ncbi:MAG: glucoamylase family protein [Gaiellaceae bacterium]